MTSVLRNDSGPNPLLLYVSLLVSSRSESLTPSLPFPLLLITLSFASLALLTRNYPRKSALLATVRMCSIYRYSTRSPARSLRYRAEVREAWPARPHHRSLPLARRRTPSSLRDALGLLVDVPLGAPTSAAACGGSSGGTRSRKGSGGNCGRDDGQRVVGLVLEFVVPEDTRGGLVADAQQLVEAQVGPGELRQVSAKAGGGLLPDGQVRARKSDAVGSVRGWPLQDWPSRNFLPASAAHTVRLVGQRVETRTRFGQRGLQEARDVGGRTFDWRSRSRARRARRRRWPHRLLGVRDDRCRASQPCAKSISSARRRSLAHETYA